MMENLLRDCFSQTSNAVDLALLQLIQTRSHSKIKNQLHAKQRLKVESKVQVGWQQ